MKLIFPFLSILISTGASPEAPVRHVQLNESTILCPPSALDTCTLAMSRPLPVFPGFLRKAAYAYSYRPHCEQVGEPLELSHDGTGVLKDAPGGSIDLKGFPNAARDVTNKHRWAVVEFSRTADRDKTHGTEKQVKSLWTCGNVYNMSYCHTSIDC